MRKSNVEKILDLLPLKPEESAALVELEYTSDSQPGFTRRKNGKGFVYSNGDGKIIKNSKIVNRINSLVIPPAWTSVWVSKSENGHIQATGRDAKGRKQYIYHQKWNEVRNQTKFYRMIRFAEALPLIRERIENDLRKKNLSREKVLALIIKLLEKTMIRVGNQEYAANGSYGLTTLKDEHLVTDGDKFQLIFIGKSGKRWEVDIENKRLARIIKQCQDLPGQELFQYVDEEGMQHLITSSDVNAYIAETMGENYTAKDFRTWNGTVIAAKELFLLGAPESDKDAKKKITMAIKHVSNSLNNTPAICRGYYIHPDLIASFLDGSLFTVMKSSSINGKPDGNGLSDEEKCVLQILKTKIKI